MATTTIRLLRTFRFDATDERVFEAAAAPGEWAVPGGFAFAGADLAALAGKRRQAFRSGFLGLASFGWSTFTVVAEADLALREELARALAAHLVDRHGAPDLAAALPAAREEVAFAESVAERQPGTVLLVEREPTAEGDVRERFRAVARPDGSLPHGRVWELAPDAG